MKLTVYTLKTCDTCRKAIKALDAAGHDLTLVDVRADGVDADTLARLMDSAGYEALLNTRSTTWRGLADENKTSMDAAKAQALILEHPTLMKRPVIDTGTEILVGWKKDVTAKLV